MNKQELVRNEMVKAMKEKDKPKKETLSLLLAALKNAEIDKMGILSESEEDAVVQKEIKQTKETLDLAPVDRTDIIQECKYRIEVLSQFAPKMMTEEEIEVTIAGVLSDLGIENPTKKEKGKIMKTLMPMVKGKADGKLVNQILEKEAGVIMNVGMIIGITLMVFMNLDIIGYMIADWVKPLQKIYCKIGWHCHMKDYEPISFDGASVHCKCKWCGYKGMVDSQGNLF